MGRFHWENDRLIETRKGGEGTPIFSKMKFKAVLGIPLFCVGLFLMVGTGCRRQGVEVSSEAVEGQVPRLRELDFTPFESALGRLSSESVRRVTKLIEGSTVLQVQEALQAKEVTAERARMARSEVLTFIWICIGLLI